MMTSSQNPMTLWPADLAMTADPSGIPGVGPGLVNPTDVAHTPVIVGTGAIADQFASAVSGLLTSGAVMLLAVALIIIGVWVLAHE